MIAVNIVLLIALGVYANGVIGILYFLSIAMCLFLTGYILPPRMQEFLGNFSIAEVATSLYGQKFGFITAVSSIIL